jgi:uncharacterized protein with PIN domain
MVFVADAMLGRLARWMRFLGYDVLYYRDIEDRELVRISRASGRVIITRDRRLPKDFRVHCLLISSEEIEKQLLEVASKFPLPPEVKRRCMKCNDALEGITEKEEVRDLLPDYIYIHHDTFQRCPSCGSIYWEGSHTKNMIKMIDKIHFRDDSHHPKNDS